MIQNLFKYTCIYTCISIGKLLFQLDIKDIYVLCCLLALNLHIFMFNVSIQMKMTIRNSEKIKPMLYLVKSLAYKKQNTCIYYLVKGFFFYTKTNDLS